MINIKTFAKNMGVKYLYDLNYCLLDKACRSTRVVPQTYSFMSFISHGVGAHAYLYYLSLCDGIYPLPWFILNTKSYVFNKRSECISLRFLMHYLKNKINMSKNTWGLTFDGSLKNVAWIEKNCRLVVPAILLVRDPIEILASNLNLVLWTKILQMSNFSSYDKTKIKEDDLSHLDVMVNFKSSPSLFLNKCSSIHYFDTKEFLGNSAQATMNRVGEIVGKKIEHHDIFGKSINDIFKRSFERKYCLDGFVFYVSPFADKFSLHVNKLVYKTDRREILDVYSSRYFLDEVLYITSGSCKHMTFAMREKLFSLISRDEQKLYEQQMVYKKNKIHNNEVIDFLKKSPNHSCTKKIFEYEISDLAKTRADIIDTWKYFHQFMNI